MPTIPSRWLSDHACQDSGGAEPENRWWVVVGTGKLSHGERKVELGSDYGYTQDEGTCEGTCKLLAVLTGEKIDSA